MHPESRHFSQVNNDDRENAIVYVIDDDELIRTSLSSLLRSVGHQVQTFATTEDFLGVRHASAPSCLILDVRLRGESGLTFQELLAKGGELQMPIIFMTGHGDIAMSVRAMKAGALDFLVKPFRDQDMIDAVTNALERDARRLQADRSIQTLRTCYQSLTPRERQVIGLVVKGLMNKQIAAQMGIAEITAKLHRAQAMKKMESRSVADLVRKIEALGVAAKER
jgi:FixJ family two-component response regulator